MVDEACANVRVQLDSQPEEIDNLERKRMQLEIELHALEKEKDKASKARLVEVSNVSLKHNQRIPIRNSLWFNLVLTEKLSNFAGKERA